MACSGSDVNPTIDSFHPLYLHPSDTPGLPLVSFKLTGSENYTLWSKVVVISLLAKNKIGFIDGTCTRDSVDASLHHIWDRCNALVLAWIMNSVSTELMSGIVYATNASVVWKDFKERFDEINGLRFFHLYREICNLRQGKLSVSSYFTKLQLLCDEFTSMCDPPSCPCEKSKKYLEMQENQRLFQFLMGLNDSYSAIRSQLLLMTPLPTVKQAYSMINQGESHRGLSDYFSA